MDCGYLRRAGILPAALIRFRNLASSRPGNCVLTGTRALPRPRGGGPGNQDADALVNASVATLRGLATLPTQRGLAALGRLPGLSGLAGAALAAALAAGLSWLGARLSGLSWLGARLSGLSWLGVRLSGCRVAASVRGARMGTCASGRGRR